MEKNENSERLTPSQERAVFLLATKPLLSIKEVAAQLGVTDRTVRNWRVNPRFRQAVNEARGELVSTALAGLQHASMEAVGVLREALGSGNEHARLRAADLLLGHLTKLSDLKDFAERLAALEEKMNATS